MNQNICFEKLTQDNLPLLRLWFKEPHVMKWWPTPENEDEFYKHFLERCRSKDTFAYIAKLNKIPFGYIQYYYVNIDKDDSKWLPKDLPQTIVGIDQLIGDPHYVGKGYGALMIKKFITYITQILDPHITTIIVDPNPTNSVAIKCYEKVGFKKISIFNTSEGQALLMRYDVK